MEEEFTAKHCAAWLERRVTCKVAASTLVNTLFKDDKTMVWGTSRKKDHLDAVDAVVASKLTLQPTTVAP